MTNRLVNPRLNDYFKLDFNQDNVDFLIPHLTEDIRLYVDPFLLWASDNGIYQQLHDNLLAFFDRMRALVQSGQQVEVLRNLLRSTEPREFGLGYALGSNRGSTIGPRLASDIIGMYENIPQLEHIGLNHIEEISLFVPGIAEDRISDLAVSLLKSFFIDFTIDRAAQHKIPTQQFNLPNIYDLEKKTWLGAVKVELPFNPIDNSPLLFVPLNILRHLPWINYEDYYRSYYARYVLPPDNPLHQIHKEEVLAYNRAHFANVKAYVDVKERTAHLCKPDPLFVPLKIETIGKRFSELTALPTGMEEKNDKMFEKIVFDLLSTLLYPELDFAQSQVRTIEGTHIRDLIFYNDGKTQFLDDIRKDFGARQLVFELKNVKSIDGNHINQLYRYLGDEFGHFGILVARNPPSKAMMRNTIELYQSKNYEIICLNDSDIALMINTLGSSKSPVDVILKKHLEFKRYLPQ